MLGLAVLSKISALFPAIGIALYPILIKEKRHWLKNIHYYGSFALAFLIFLPFIIWNFQNDFAFVRNQGSHIYRGGGIGHFINLWLGIAVISGPLFFYFSVFFFFPYKQQKRKRNPIAKDLFTSKYKKRIVKINWVICDKRFIFRKVRDAIFNKS